MTNEDGIDERAKIIIDKLRTATTRQEVYSVLDNAVEQYDNFNMIDDTVFEGFGFRFQVSLTIYSESYDLNAIVLENEHIDEITVIKYPDSRCVFITRFLEK